MLDFGFYNMDCMDGMRKFPDGYFDLAIVDPPYGININNNMGRRKGDNNSNYPKAYWDNATPRKEYFDELFRVSKHQIIWGGITLICHRQNVSLYGENRKFPKTLVSLCVSTHGRITKVRQKSG